MKKIICLLLLVITLATAHAQSTITWHNPIVDETWVYPLKGDIKVVTANAKVYKGLMENFGHLVWKQVKRTVKDRYGMYDEISVYFKRQHALDIINYLKSLP